ncbi:MAG: hypothetical protein HOP36_15660 [Methyloglobulus sp.]|nr:hypothetical protein [Methyloglobulus sp.]
MNLKPAQLHHQKSYSSANEAPAKPEFPSARYFQVHFEHLESQQDETKRCLEKLQQHMAELYQRMAMLTPDLINPKVKK